MSEDYPEPTASGDYLEVVTDPESFFARELENPSAALPAAVVLVVAVLTTIASWISAQRVMKLSAKMAESQEGAEVMREIMGIAAGVVAFFGFLGAFLALLFYAGAFYVLSELMDGEGSFKDTVLVAGWGFLPKAVEELVSIFGAMYLRTAVRAPETVTQETLNEFSRQMTLHPVNLFVFVLGLAGLAVSGYIWAGGLQEARDLSRKQALIAAGIPSGLIVLIRVGTTVNSLV